MELVYKKSPSHTGNLLSNLKSNGDFCDVAIKCGDFKVMAHKCVLTASTEYFRRMLMTDTHEAKTGIIHFSAMFPKIVKQCVDFIYSGSVGLSMETARGLIDAAEMLHLPKLSELCVEFLAENIDMDNFAEVIALSCLYNKALLNTPIREFLDANLPEVVRSEAFKSFDYTTVDYCYDLMQGSSRAIEQSKWTGLMAWTNADLENRETQFHDLFQKINLQCFPRDFVKKHICSENIIDGSVKSLQYVRRFVADKLPSVKERITSPSHITCINESTRLVYEYDLRGGEWKVVAELPSTICQHQSVAEYNGILYVGNGQSLHSFSEAGWKCLHALPAYTTSSKYNRVVCAGRWVIMVTDSHTVLFEISSGNGHDVRHSQNLPEFTEGSFVLGLDATVYVLGGTQRTVPSETQRTVPSGTQRTVPSGTQRTVPSGTQRTVPGGTPWTVPSGTQRTVPGGTPWTVPSGTQRTVPSGTPWTVPSGTQRTVPIGTQRTAPNGTPWTVPNGTQRTVPSVLGGTQKTSITETGRTVLKLKLEERYYSAVAPMVMNREYGAAVHYKGHLYAMGGNSRTVEFHNIRTKQWQILRGCEIQCRNVTVHLADKLYIFGGALGTEVKTVELDQLEIDEKDLRPTRRSAGAMGMCCMSHGKYAKLSR